MNDSDDAGTIPPALDHLSVKHRVWISLDSPGTGQETQSRRSRRKDTTSFIVGMGVARLLSAIDRNGSLSAAAQELGYSYKYAWDRTQKIKERLGGVPAVEAHKGGKGGGGEMVLTPAGRRLLDTYTMYDDFIEACKEKHAFLQSCLDNEELVSACLESAREATTKKTIKTTTKTTSSENQQ